MSLAAILQEYGFVPTVPTSPGRSGTPESKQLRAVPTVPTVPTQKSEVTAALVRTVVKFRLPGGCPGSNCTAIGTKPREEIIAELRRLHGDVVEVLP